MPNRKATVRPYEFSADFRAPEAAIVDVPPQVSLQAHELAALLAQARFEGEQAAADGIAAQAEARVVLLERRLEAALADLIALARFVDRRAAGTGLESSTSALCSRLADGQGDLFPAQAEANEDMT